MTFLKLLGRVEIRAVVAAVAASAILAVVALVQTLMSSGENMFSPFESAHIVFLYSIVCGAPLAIIYGAPLYALLLYSGHASWAAALLIGISPGLAVYLLVENEQLLGLWIGGGGLAAVLLVHISMRHSVLVSRASGR